MPECWRILFKSWRIFPNQSWWRSCGQASQVVSTLKHHLHVCGWTRPVFWLVWMGGNGLLSPQCSYISSPYSPAAQMAPAQCSHFYSLHHSYNSAKCKCATHYEHHNSHRGFIKRKRVEVEETLKALQDVGRFVFLDYWYEAVLLVLSNMYKKHWKQAEVKSLCMVFKAYLCKFICHFSALIFKNMSAVLL